MPQVFGELRPDATQGEREVFRRLRDNLPRDYDLYIECLIPGDRQLRAPDFIILTNYGVIILEIKDWIQVQKADRYGADILMRDGQSRREHNAVGQARQYALKLRSNLQRLKDQRGYRGEINVPWGCAAVFPNLGPAALSALQTAWGEEYVLGRGDLESPDRLLARLRRLMDPDHLATLTREVMDLVRGTINPQVVVAKEALPPVILDREQETLVMAPAREPEAPKPEAAPAPQLDFFASAPPPKTEPHAPVPAAELEARIIHNTAVRLVRGVAGSGKTLVLTQRAVYLARQYPEWKVLVLGFNHDLMRSLQPCFRGCPNIKSLTFHNFCSELTRLAGQPWVSPDSCAGWLRNYLPNQPEPTYALIENELRWLMDSGVPDLAAYKAAERRGLGRLPAGWPRERLFEIYQAYLRYLENDARRPDWAQVPWKVLELADSGALTPPQYDAVLIDEAQDFAPVWLRLVQRVLKPDGLLFMADDPTQSIYRFYSWAEKGVPVVGRTRWLRVPYRNTFEIYRSAYALIEEDELVLRMLASEGIDLKPDLNSQSMRHGQRPLLQRARSLEEQATYIQSAIANLRRQEGLAAAQIAVLARRHKTVGRLKKLLDGLDVAVDTIHSQKGLEYEAVFLPELQEVFEGGDSPEDLSEQRRLTYMAMTRARQKLYLGVSGSIPAPLRPLMDYVDAM